MIGFQGIIPAIVGSILWIVEVVGAPRGFDSWRVYGSVTVTLYALVLAACVLFLRRRHSVPRNGTSVPPSSHASRSDGG